MKAPMLPPIAKKINTYTKPDEKLFTKRKVTVTAIIIPTIPNKLPCLEVSGEDKPLKAKINNIPDIRYKIAEKFGVVGTPTTFFINRDGEAIFKYTSSDINDPRLEQAVKAISDT